MVHLDSIYISTTYGGCLEGIPSIDNSIDRAKKKAAELFGKGRATLVLPIKIKDLKHDVQILPKYQHIAKFSSYKPIVSGHGSNLIVIWFNDNPSSDIVPILDTFDWNAHAEDWEI